MGTSYDNYKAVLDTSTTWEAWRSGGSNGMTSFTNLFWKFLSASNTSPRNGMGMIILQFDHHWEFLYLSPYQETRKLCKVPYKQPHHGGQIKKKEKLLRSHPKVKGFAMSKLVCAAVLEVLHRDQKVAVAREAVRREMKFGVEAMNETSTGMEAINYFVMKHCNFTLVTHRVRFHVDRGKGTNTSFLENRVVLKSKKNVTEPSLPEGRGYVDKNHFEFALIDW